MGDWKVYRVTSIDVPSWNHEPQPRPETGEYERVVLGEHNDR